MKKNQLIFVVSYITCAFVLSMTMVFTPNEKIEVVKSAETVYSLSLDETQKITNSVVPSNDEFSGSVRTIRNNGITLCAYKMINNDGGWQTLLPGGYFYNPIDDSVNHNKISGIKSIEYVGNGVLEFHYGYSINNTEIIYSLEETLVAGTPFIFENEFPSYFYLVNNGNNNVDIDEINIEYSCLASSYPRNNLNVLMIGNSFADDTLFYSARIAASLEININLYDAYIGGCTLNNHYSNITSETATYSMRNMNGNEWNYRDNMSLNSIVSNKTWDIISFQQASAEIGRSTSYTNLINLVNKVKTYAPENAKYYWHQTWAYDSDYSEYYDYFSYFNNDQEEMFDAIVDCYNSEVASTGLFEKTIFNGTAIQNIRTSYMGDVFSRDGKHMSHVHGRFVVACNFISTILNIDFKLSPVKYIPEGMNESFLDLANEAIENARKHPNEITNSKYVVNEMAEYDLSNYTEIDAGLVGCSYYYSQDDTKYSLRNNHVSGTSNKYASTYRFTKETLPVGSLVFIGEGFGYRPEAWIDDSRQSFRKNEAWNNVIEINEEFWEGYQYRAFNIFKAGKTPLSGEYVDEQYDEIFDAFHIFVPNNKMAGLNPKTYNSKYYADSTLFENNGLDIDDYQRVHLDPITGFYKCDSYYYLMNSYVDDTAKKFVCTRPFYMANGDLPVGTILIIDSGYQWRSDCWTERGTTSRPNNVTTNFTIIDSSFISPYRRRTFNVSSTNSYYVGQNSIEFMNHFRIYIPIA